MIVLATIILFFTFVIIHFQLNSTKIAKLLACLKRDLKYVVVYLQAIYRIQKLVKNHQTVVKLFAKTVKRCPNKICFYFENETWTFQEVEDYSNRVANFFKKEGYKHGDKVALYLENSPKYACIWLGLAKIGVISALINTNLITDTLIHSIEAANVKSVIFSKTLEQSIKEVADRISAKVLYSLWDKKNSNSDLEKKLETVSKSAPDFETGSPNDVLMYMYTSGTTGLPKAAIFTNKRFMLVTTCISFFANISENDIIYDALPLYHASGTVVPIGSSFYLGASTVIKKKFSASSFWTDCITYKCTVFVYIGELCRYLLSTYQNKNEKINHSITRIIGNGLKPQIWEPFVKKFDIKQVYEFYGSSEGNTNIINLVNKPKSVGYFPRFMSALYPTQLVKCHLETGIPIRGEDGLCIVCKPGEKGLFVGKVIKDKSISEFAGYLNNEDTEKKIIRNVLKKGDIYFNSGDVLCQDEEGFYYFHDRIGDTFRWKGENVATTEVEAVISNIVNLQDSIVYGVEIPNTEGRAGMVAIVDSEKSLDLSKLAKDLKANLPTYAIPLFLRIVNQVALTGTFKLQKTKLQKEGFNIELIQDDLYLYDTKANEYVPLNKEKYEAIINQEIKF